MKNALLFFSVILLSLFSCKNDCQEQLDQIQSAKNTYQTNPTEANCINYKNLMESYLNSSCESESYQVDYEKIFIEEISYLSCQ